MTGGMASTTLTGRRGGGHEYIPQASPPGLNDRARRDAADVAAQASDVAGDAVVAPARTDGRLARGRQGRKSRQRLPILVGVLTAAILGSGVWLVVRNREQQAKRLRASEARRALRENAKRALRTKRESSEAPAHPHSITAHEGMRSIPNTGMAPSGALDQEGHRPVLERSRKVR